MEIASYWIREIAFMISGIVFIHVMEQKKNFRLRLTICTVLYLLLSTVMYFLPIKGIIELEALARGFRFLFVIIFLYTCWKVTWSVSIYYSIWGFISWQLLYELWVGLRILGGESFTEEGFFYPIGFFLTFFIGNVVSGITIAKWMPAGGAKNIGPRQLISAFVIFFTFETIKFTPRDSQTNPGDGTWEFLYLTQVLIAVILYLQSELFKKSAMRQELSVMNLLWDKAQQQYQLSQENISLINQKCHDLKHQVRAIRNASKEDIDKYLAEMENSIHIYEAIVKTGNEVLDTVLTEKSLYCREREITISCMADGSQLDFINTVDLYTILGNAIDNAIEAVEKFKHKEKRQIDVLIYRQQDFLVLNVINPIKGNLVYDEELPVTTKSDKSYHGYGLKSMKHLVNKYDGFLSIIEEDGCFSLKMLIPVPSST